MTPQVRRLVATLNFTVGALSALVVLFYWPGVPDATIARGVFGLLGTGIAAGIYLVVDAASQL